MCKVYNKKAATVKSRIERGWNLKDALTKESNPFNMPKECKDHLGNYYESFIEMCKAYKKDSTTVKARLRKGWTLEAALTENNITAPVNINIFNIEYNSISEAANKYNIRYTTVIQRLKRKWDIELAFVYPPIAPIIRVYYVGIDNKTRYKMDDNIYTAEELIAKYAPEYLELYRKTNPQGIYHFYKK